ERDFEAEALALLHDEAELVGGGRALLADQAYLTQVALGVEELQVGVIKREPRGNRDAVGAGVAGVVGVEVFQDALRLLRADRGRGPEVGQDVPEVSTHRADVQPRIVLRHRESEEHLPGLELLDELRAFAGTGREVGGFAPLAGEEAREAALTSA